MKTPFFQFLVSAVVLAGACTASAQGTAFTYQGRLASGANPASGIYDLRFAIYDSTNSPGTLIAGPITNAATPVTNGLFTVTLDFGSGVFTGTNYWLEIAVQTNGGTAFTTLTPRQAVTPTPYALYAPSAGAAASANAVAATNITGTIGVSQLSALVVTNGASGLTLSGAFTGNASGLTNVETSSLTGELSLSSGFSPGLAGHIDAGGDALGVAVSGNYCYLANNEDGLRIYDISNPSSPINVAHIATGWNTKGVAVSGNYCYLADDGDGLFIHDISNPSSPTNVAYIDNGGYAYGVAVSGNYCYLANHGDGLRIYDISNPSGPTNVAHIDNGGLAYGVAVSGNYCYLANDTDGLRIYDISNPSSPTNVAHINDGGYAYGVAVAGNYCYLANEDDGLRVYDISNPSSPANVGHIDNGGSAHGVAVSGNYCYLANEDDGLRIYALKSVNAFSSLAVSGVLNVGSDLNVSRDLYVAGAFGLGTTNPQKRLEVRATSLADGIRVDGYNKAAGIQLSTNDTVCGEWGVAVGAGNYSADALPGDVILRTAATAKLLLQNSDGSSAIAISNNLVGIGKASPTTALDVNGTVTATAFAGSGAGLSGLNVTNLTGTVALANLPATVLTNNATGVTLSGTFSGNGGGLTNLGAGSFTATAWQQATNLNGGCAALASNVVTGIGITNAWVTNSVLAGNGFGLTNLNATNLTGTLADARLSANVALLNTNQTFTGTNVFSFVGVGGTDIDAPLSVNSTASFSGNVLKLQAPGAPDNYCLLGRAATGTRWVSWNFDQMNYNTTYSNVLVVRSGSVGVGTDNPQKRLEVVAQGSADGLRVEGNGFAPSLQMTTNETMCGELGVAMVGGQFSTDAAAGDFVIRSSASGKLLVQNGAGGSAIAITNNCVGIGNTSPTNRLMVVNARCDGSSWINASDRNLKQSFAPVNAQAVLEKVTALPVQTWSYKAQPGETHLGPVAQDFHAAFGLGADDVSIATVDESGVALAAIKGLNEKLEARSQKLEQVNAELKAQLAELRDLVQKLARPDGAK